MQVKVANDLIVIAFLEELLLSWQLTGQVVFVLFWYHSSDGSLVESSSLCPVVQFRFFIFCLLALSSYLDIDIEKIGRELNSTVHCFEYF